MRKYHKSSLFSAIFISILFMTASGILTGPARAESRDVSVYVDGFPVQFDVRPVILNGRTMVPFRALAEALGTAVAWDGSSKTVKASDNQTNISLQIGNKMAYRNGESVLLDAPPTLINGRTLIPLRFFSEAMGCRVQWMESSSTVNIFSAPKTMTVVGFYALGDIQTSSWTNLFGTKYPSVARGNTDLVSTLALGWYSLDKEGNLLTKSRTGWQRPDDWEKVLEAAKKYDLQTQMVVHMADGDGSASALLSSDPAVVRAAESIADEADSYQGVNIDIEGLGWSGNAAHMAGERDAFTNFIQQLSKLLKEKGVSLALTLHPPNSAYKGYDYKILGSLADSIIIMAYDYGSRPEPEAKVAEAVAMAKASVPSGKLILGISGPSETSESILTKVGIAKRYDLKGIALWRLGLVSDEMWSNLRMTLVANKNR